MKTLLTLLFLSAFTSLTASAKWAPLPLKSLIENSDSIVVAGFIAEDSRKTEGHRTDQLVTLKVTTIIKGTPPEQISVAGYEVHICAAQFIFPTTKGEKYLLFLQKSNNQYQVLNGTFGALTITDNKVNWFTDDTKMQNLGERKLTELDTVIAAIKQAIEPPSSPAMTEAQAIEVLMKIETFGFGGAKGENIRTSDTAFQTLLSSPNAKEQFTTLFEKGNTPARLYALCALYSLDKVAFEKLSKSFKLDEKIFTQFGCVVDELKASEILKNISNGDYERYSKAPEKD
jgi:hypothetical protein